ncbi:MAG: phosphatidylglycerophosphatase A [Nitrospirae bacterium]|nr:phosphatidylglycerophosphatase A [Nitrospirota bacterium]
MGIFQRQQIIKFLATGFYSGYSPLAPGTAGSLVGILLYLLIQNISYSSYITIVVLIFGIGVYISAQAEVIYQKKDCSNIVIDEIAGMLVSLAFFSNGPGRIKFIISGFILFRIFDIIKPFPVRTIDRKLGGGWGIMLDDIMAGVYANLLLRVLGWVLAW